MARGLPDDSNIVKEGPVYGLHDDAELAARLGSPVNFIRFGDVFMLDDFESGRQAWETNLWGVGAFARLCGTYTRSKGVSVHLASGTGATPMMQLWRGLPTPESSKVGFGCAFMLGQDVLEFIIGMVTTIAEQNYHYYVGYNVVNKKLYYWDNAGARQEFADLFVRGFNWPFHLCKLVANFTTHYYVRFYVDDKSYDLSTYPAQMTGAVGQADYIQVTLNVRGGLVAAGHVYVDDAVATQNEF